MKFLAFRLGFFALLYAVSISVAAQTNKKPLSHDVYDDWKSLGWRSISNNGIFAAYEINPQQGDGNLVIRNLEKLSEKIISRGYNANFTNDSRYLICKIKPLYQQTRNAMIKKKTGKDLPKDSLCIYDLLTDSMTTIPGLLSYKLPAKGSGWLAYIVESVKADKETLSKDSTDHAIKSVDQIADSIFKSKSDSLKGKWTDRRIKKWALKLAKGIYKKSNNQKKTDSQPSQQSTSGDSDHVLVIVRFSDGEKWEYGNVEDYFFDKHATRLLINQYRVVKDSVLKSNIILMDLSAAIADTIMHQFNKAKGFAFDETGNQLAFVAERDSSLKALQRFFKLWYYRTGMDSAILYADRNTIGMPLGFAVSEYGMINFSRDGKHLYFGTAPVIPAADTTIVDFEQPRLDIWHYNDDYLQPKQLRDLGKELQRSYVAVKSLNNSFLVQLGRPEIEHIALVDEGNANWVLGTTTRGNRVKTQWEDNTWHSAYFINCLDGKSIPVVENANATFYASPDGKFIYWYDLERQNYFAYDVAEHVTRNITAKIPTSLYNTEDDNPRLHSPVGNIGWLKYDDAFYVRDMFDIWKVDPRNKLSPVNLTKGYGRKSTIVFRLIKADPDQRYLDENTPVLLQGFNKQTKEAGIFSQSAVTPGNPKKEMMGPYKILSLLKSKDTSVYLIQMSDVTSSELYLSYTLDTTIRLTHISEQQKNFNWLTVELKKWKMFDGRIGEGLLYKPENFNPKKKYPIIFYFYERNADELYRYLAPAPSASVINIPWFVSNGYIVFDPNIYYKTGDPGESAYNSVVSAAKYFAKMPWIDSTRMGIQGQSWGGYQVAYLVTRTHLFRAAEAGAPVSNMTSAYGGIRWESGKSRNFQYEKSQSRIGASLWQDRNAYIRNSPLFYADKITTPLLIMSNDKDGAVPWEQGIELFTAMRRLGKKVWLLQYNDESHNLMERRNRKDLSIRLGQFFDYYLKGAKPASWIINGLPATKKGKTLGYD